MNENKKKVKALGLCSGGLDSMLAGVVLARQGLEVVWVSFETPFFSAGKARKASRLMGIPLIVKDITERYMRMLKNPSAGYGKYMNPCMDCHALMFRVAGEMMPEINADFLFSGEVLGQRPMSQTKSSLRYVAKHSGYDGLILRPLSAKRMPETEMEKNGLVDRQLLHDFSGRSRKPQIQLARALGITDYPGPGGGCRLTDPNFSKRLTDLFAHVENASREEFELLKHGRHIRISPAAKIVVGRDMADNDNILSLYRPENDIRIILKDIPGPACLMPYVDDEDAVRTGAAVCAGYSRVESGKPVNVNVLSPSGLSVLSVMPLQPGDSLDLHVL